MKVLKTIKLFHHSQKKQTILRMLAQFLAWFLNFILMGPAYGASEDTLKKWAASHCTWLYLFLQCTPDGQPAPLIYNTHYWGLPSYKIGRFKKLHTDDFYAWRLISWFRTTWHLPYFLAIILPVLVMAQESTCLEMWLVQPTLASGKVRNQNATTL